MYLIKVEEHISKDSYVSRFGIGNKRNALMFETPRQLPLVIDWGSLEAKLTRYDENNEPVGYYKCDGEIVASVRRKVQ